MHQALASLVVLAVRWDWRAEEDIRRRQAHIRAFDRYLEMFRWGWRKWCLHCNKPSSILPDVLCNILYGTVIWYALGQFHLSAVRTGGSVVWSLPCQQVPIGHQSKSDHGAIN